MKNKITIIGGGNMGGALIEGFLKSGKIAPSELTVGDASEAVRTRFQQMGLAAYADNREAVAGAGIVILAVKPWLVETVAEKISKSLADNTLIVSLAAGVTLDGLESAFGTGAACFRTIPNIAAALGASMTFVACRERERGRMAEVLELFATVGEAAAVDEKLMDAAMVSGSCGTAYALRFLRAAMEASIEMGLSAPLSRTVVAQTMRGAAELLLAGDLHPEELIDRVTTPGGITIAGLNAMEHKGFSSAVIEGHIAALKRVKGE